MTTPVVVEPKPGGRRWYDYEPARTVIGAGAWLVAPWTGSDGRPSWWKLMSAAVLLHYALIERRLPETVAIVLIFSAFGIKVVSQMIASGVAKLSVSSFFSQALGPRQAAPAAAPGPVVPPGFLRGDADPHAPVDESGP